MSRQLKDAETIRALADILTETGLNEIEIEDKDGRIRVARSAPVGIQTMVPAPSAPIVSGSTVSSSSSSSMEPVQSANAITSPMVGIAYLAPEPSAPPFVSVGQKVVEGQTLMLIEAMKTFNQIKSPRSGVVTKILVESGAPVEFGEALAIVE